jgi:hypothetical protein
VHLVLGQRFGAYVSRNDGQRVKLSIDNLGAKYIVHKISLRSRAILRKVRVLQLLLDQLGINLDLNWLPSAEKIFADRLSRPI